jgi:AraC family transcriptional activator of pobA
MSVAEIAYAVGFEDPAYFSRFFTRHVGQPPRTYRAARERPQP